MPFHILLTFASDPASTALLTDRRSLVRRLALCSPVSSMPSSFPRFASQLNPSQRAELRAATERFGAQALELARLERLKAAQRGGGRLQPLQRKGPPAAQAGGGVDSLSLSRATSAPHMLYNQPPTSAHAPPPGMSFKGGSTMPLGGASNASLPAPIFDAWQRGIAIPGMPPPPMPLSPERRKLLEERRRVKAKKLVEEWRQSQLEMGEKWVDKTRWYSQGDTPPAWYRRRAAQGPGYAPKAHRASSPRLLQGIAKSRSTSSLPPPPKAEEGDVAGEGEEDFETGMRQTALERDAADEDGDGKLDMHEVRVPHHAAIVRPPSPPTAASAYHITWWHAVL